MIRERFSYGLVLYAQCHIVVIFLDLANDRIGARDGKGDETESSRPATRQSTSWGCREPILAWGKLMKARSVRCSLRRQLSRAVCLPRHALQQVSVCSNLILPG